MKIIQTAITVLAVNTAMTGFTLCAYGQELPIAPSEKEDAVVKTIETPTLNIMTESVKTPVLKNNAINNIVTPEIWTPPIFNAQDAEDVKPTNSNFVKNINTTGNTP